MAMDLDDLMPRSQKPKPRDLSLMSVGDLKDYIADLQAEIARAEAMIASKQSSRSEAEKWFKS